MEQAEERAEIERTARQVNDLQQAFLDFLQSYSDALGQTIDALDHLSSGEVSPSAKAD